MRKLLFFVLLLAGTLSATAQVNFNFRVQLIHNAPDPAIDTTDVYFSAFGSDILVKAGFIYGTVDGLGNRTVPVPVPLTSIAGSVKLVRPGGSATNAADVRLTIPSVTIFANDTFAIVLSGTLANAKLTKFRIKETVPTGQASIRILHGSSDAPAVDVKSNPNSATPFTLGSNLSYGDTTAQLNIPALPPPTQTDTIALFAAGTSSNIARYNTSLGGALSGKSAILIARGFAFPGARPAGVSPRPTFSIWVVFADGSTAELNSISRARIQLVHNAADVAVDSVKAYTSQLGLLGGLKFRTATGFLDFTLPLAINNQLIDFGFGAPSAAGINDTIISKWVSISPEDTLFIIANGLTSGVGAAAFNVFKLDAINEVQPLFSGSVASGVRLFHGVTDAPAFNLYQNLVAVKTWPPLTAALNWSYGTSTISIPVRVAQAPGAFVDVALASNTDSVVATYRAATESFPNKRLLAVASGLLNTGGNANLAFNVFAVPPTGGKFVALPQFGYLHVVHNSAVPAASTVDVQLAFVGTPSVSNFDSVTYRSSTGFRPVPVGPPIRVRVYAHATGATTVGAVIDSFPTFNIGSGRSVVAFIDGVVGTGYASNPSLVPTTLGLTVVNHAPQWTFSGNFQLLVNHGVTDAPAIDVRTGATTLISNKKFRESARIAPAVGTYTLDITPAGVPGTKVRSSIANLSSLSTSFSSSVVYASGFLTPGSNNNGPELDLVVATPAGGANIVLPRAATGIESGFDASFNVYPNPINGSAILSYGIDRPLNLVASLIDLNGRVVSVLDNGYKASGNYQVNVNTNNVPAGVYFIRLEGDGLRKVGKVVVN
jgi:hypothetical protein